MNGALNTSAGFRRARQELEDTYRPHVDKLTSAGEATVELIADSDHVAVGGTCYSRTPTALLFAMLRSHRRDLTLSRPLSCYEVELALASGACSRVVTSWVGIGLRWGLPLVLRHYVEHGLATYEEWSHLALGLRYKAGAMGVPFLPGLSMLGSDLARADDLRTVTCPYTGSELAAFPALNPDVALVHVHRADRHGNAQVDGYWHMDVDMARAARRVIVSAERIVTTEEIMRRPTTTMLPHFAVDAVVEAPFGSYPSEMYGSYEADFAHFDTYSELVRHDGPEGARRYVEENAEQPRDFAAFLDTVGPDHLAGLRLGAEKLMPR
ncbi:MAG: CoA transferase subunit A [Acidimicrobiales bacterium]